MGAREYDPRTARWLQRDPIGAASGDPNLYRYAGNDPINWFDSGGLQATRKLPPGVSKTKEDCEKILDAIEHRMKELSKDIENAMKGKSPLADLQGQIGEPGGHMCELEAECMGLTQSGTNTLHPVVMNTKSSGLAERIYISDTEACNAVSPSGQGSWKM